MSRRYRKSDIDFHGTNGAYNQTPAVNVKVHAGISDGWKAVEQYRSAEGYDAAFTPAWLAAHVARVQKIDPERESALDYAVSAFLDSWWESACEVQLEAAQEDLDYFFGNTPLSVPEHARCWLTGRSGGWLYVGDAHGRPLWRGADVATWDAIAVAAWGRFEKACRVYADEVPYQALDLVYRNVYEPEQEQQERIVAEMVA